MMARPAGPSGAKGARPLVVRPIVLAAMACLALSSLAAPASAVDVTLTAVADATVVSSMPTTNLGGVTTLVVGFPSPTAMDRALLQFDLSSIPAGSAIGSAVLQLSIASGTPSPALLGVEAWRIESPWGELSVTWSTQPAQLSFGNSAPVPFTPGVVQWDVKNLVTMWLSGVPNHGVALRVAASETTGIRTFSSRDASIPSARPQLLIGYTPPAPATATPTRSATATRTATPVATATGTRTPSATTTFTLTRTPTATFTTTATSTVTRTGTPIPTSSATRTRTTSPTPTVPPSTTPTRTPPPTGTSTRTVTPTVTFTRTATPTATSTAAPIQTPTLTISVSSTPTPTSSPSRTRSSTSTLSPTPTPTRTSSSVPTATHTRTVTRTVSLTATQTPSPSATATRTFAASTATPTPSGTPTRTATIDPQLAALRQLQADSLRLPSVRIQVGIPRFTGVEVPVPPSLPDDPVVRALDFLERYRDLYRLGAPRLQLYLKRIYTSATGQHVFFGQHRDGTAVYGGELAVHLRAGKVRRSSGNYLPDIPQLAPPALGIREAEAIAAAAAPGTNVRPIGEARPMYFNRRLIDRGSGATHLAWRVFVRGLAADGTGTEWLSLIDAHDGEVLLIADQSLRAEDLSVKTANNTASADCFDDNPDVLEWFTENGPTASYPDGGDVDGAAAFAAADQTYDWYFQNVDPGRDSYDDRGAQIEAFVHVAANDAHWSRACRQMVISDGMAALDLFAHELTHAVIQFGADLDVLNEPGSLGESYADFFGCMVDADDWQMGEDTVLGAIRDMSDPTLFDLPDHMDDYEEGQEHFDSGIPSKAAYLITEGGAHRDFEIRGIGRPKSRQLH